jgi:beta-glucanase (GH16 family)
VSDLYERAAVPEGPPGGPRRRRVALLVLACIAIAALVSVLVVSLRGGTGSSGSGGSTSSAGSSNQSKSGTELDPSQRLDTEAAVRNGWTLSAHDEFDGDKLDEKVWSPYRGRTTDDVGQHDPDNLSVSDGTLKLTSRGDTSAGMAWDDGQKYGRWEARVRSQQGNGYGPVMLLWPDSEDWPEDGEIDIMEIPKGDRTRAHFTLHWSEDNKQDSKTMTGDFTQWHIFAVEWTPDHIVGYLDGVEVYRNEDKDANPPGPMHFAMQQDIGPYGDDWIPAPDDSTPETCTFEVDWVRIYAA